MRLGIKPQRLPPEPPGLPFATDVSVHGVQMGVTLLRCRLHQELAILGKQ